MTIMFHYLSRFILWILGWKVEVLFPGDLKKYILVAMPHTSNWDFPLGLLVRSAIKKDIKYIGKHTLFRFPFGMLFRSLGGYPVDRSKSSNFVDATVDIFNSKETFAIAIAPEGTRSKPERLKTGFYYIAQKANIPIIFTQLDYGNKIVRLNAPFFPSGNKESDFEYMNNLFKDVQGRNPEKSYFSTTT